MTTLLNLIIPSTAFSQTRRKGGAWSEGTSVAFGTLTNALVVDSLSYRPFGATLLESIVNIRLQTKH